MIVLILAMAVNFSPPIALQLNGEIYRCEPSTAPRSAPELEYAGTLPVYEDRFCTRLSPPLPPDPTWTDGLTEEQLSQIAFIVCGPDGTNDSIENGTYSCEREGWNGKEYERSEFFCDDTPELDPESCGLNVEGL